MSSCASRLASLTFVSSLIDYFYFQISKSFEDSYDPNPPPIPPKFRPKSPRPDFSRDRDLDLQLPPERGLQQRLPSLGKIRRIKVSGSAKEGVGNFSTQAPPDPDSDSQLAATDNSDVVCFGAIIKKVFGCNGGRICFRESHIEVEVPRGAISQGHIQGFYFKVSPDSGFVEERGEDGYATHVCSPLLQFGPVGAKFHEPIRIKMPHCINLGRYILLFSLFSVRSLCCAFGYRCGGLPCSADIGLRRCVLSHRTELHTH